MHPRDGVVVVVNVRNGLHQKVAGKVGWPEDWWPTLSCKPRYSTAQASLFTPAPTLCASLSLANDPSSGPRTLSLPTNHKPRSSPTTTTTPSLLNHSRPTLHPLPPPPVVHPDGRPHGHLSHRICHRNSNHTRIPHSHSEVEARRHLCLRPGHVRRLRTGLQRRHRVSGV